MGAIQVDQEFFQLLKQEYSEKFGSSPTELLKELNRTFLKEGKSGENLISERTIRAFFNTVKPPKMQEKNLNYLCHILLGKNSYREAVRKLIKVMPDIEGDWLDPYWKHLDIKCKNMRVLDMSEPIPIDSIYVKFKIIRNIRGRRQRAIHELLAILENEVNDKNPSRLSFPGNENYLPALDTAIQYRKLMILGKPGAGKTTFLKYLAIYFPTEESIEKIIPIFIALRDISDDAGKINLLNTIIQEFTNIIPNSEDTVKQLLKNGRFLILLDGLDEIKDNSNIYRQIEQLTENFPDNRFIITCRNAACDYVFNTFTEVEIADFGQEEIEAFVKNWFQVRKEENISKRFLEKLEENQQVKELATSPLLLTILCLIYEDNYNFSDNRYELYKEAVEAFLKRWDASRRIERKSNNFKLSRQQKINMFSEIAYRGLDNKSPKFLWNKIDLETQIYDFLKKYFLEYEIDTQEIIKIMETDYGLLIQQAKGIYSFSHLTFQEYFAAEYIVENRQQLFLEEFVKNNLLERQWREVFILIAQRLSDTDEFFKLIFRRTNEIVKNIPQLQLMLSWLDKMTADAGISSSAWRAYYLAIGLDIDLYISRDTKIEGSIFGKFATKLRNYNLKHGKLTPPQPKALLISRLATIHVLAVERANIDDSENIKPKQARFPGESLQSNENLDIDINEKMNVAIEKAKQINMNDLHKELVNLQNNYPYNNAPNQEWQRWTEKLQKIMLNHLNIGHNVSLTELSVKDLEEYIYTNDLLIDCISGQNNSLIQTRNDILGSLLLPQNKIPTHLLSD